MIIEVLISNQCRRGVCLDGRDVFLFSVSHSNARGGVFEFQGMFLFKVGKAISTQNWLNPVVKTL